MELMKKTLILFAVCFVSDIVSYALPFPFPGSVIAMVILFLLLLKGTVRVEQLEPIAGFLLANMTIVFLPVTVSITSYIDVFKDIWWQFLLICTVSTIVTFVCTAYAVRLTKHIMSKKRTGDEKDA